jgi:hypothetical protein
VLAAQLVTRSGVLVDVDSNGGRLPK